MAYWGGLLVRTFDLCGYSAYSGGELKFYTGLPYPGKVLEFCL